MEDSELIRQVLNGNANAFKYLVLKHQKLVLHIAGRVVQQQEDLEDICQEVFIKVFNQIKKFRNESRLSTWIATIAYNTSVTYFRKKHRQKTDPFDDLSRISLSEPSPGIASGRFEEEEVRKYLLQLIEELPLHYRTVLTLFHLEEFSYNEIGQITGMPEGTIKSYLSRARKLLKDKIDEVTKTEKTNIFAEYVESD
jgi:RNA polymerase sigma-70 factor (ECF subfamily)